MQRTWTDKYIKAVGMLCIGIGLMIMTNVGRVYAMELNQKEKERETMCRLGIKEYEMNFILEVLRIKEWHKVPYSFDERELNPQVDRPMGSYSKEALKPYLEDDKEITVEIEYYFGGHRPSKPENKFPIQVVKIYEEASLAYSGYCMWSWHGDRVMEWQRYKREQVGGEEDNRWRKESETGKKQAQTKGKRVAESNGNFKEQYKGDTILSLENIEAVMETFMMIKDGDGLYKLTELPLTESFYSKCREEFPYIENAESMKGFWLYFWGAGEDNKLICMCIVSPYTDDRSQYVDEHYTYLVEMQLKDKQIDSMDITLLRHYLPEEK